MRRLPRANWPSCQSPQASRRSSSWRRTPPAATPRYGGGASFGGGGASENAYYINGFPVTNPLTQLGASELPFGAIAQAQVLTGGFGAEFGRSVGGVVNITTKSGTNNWEAGAHGERRAEIAARQVQEIYYANTGAANNVDTDGKL